MSENSVLLEYEDELLAALQKAREGIGENGEAPGDEPHTITTPEAKELLQLSRRRTTALLNGMCDTGILGRDMVGRVNAWGFLTRKPGYRLMKTE